MWLVVEAIDGNRLEYWHSGRFVARLNCPSGQLDELEALKHAMNRLKIEPEIPKE